MSLELSFLPGKPEFYQVFLHIMVLILSLLCQSLPNPHGRCISACKDSPDPMGKCLASDFNRPQVSIYNLGIIRPKLHIPLWTVRVETFLPPALAGDLDTAEAPF
jgi:hypothetical protein